MINVSKPIIGDEEKQAVMEVLESGMLAQGSKVSALEESFANYCGAKYAVAVSSGTAALHVGLYALGVGRGDEVITSPFTFVATANPILMQGAKIVFVDVRPEDFNIDPKEIEEKITQKTKVIIPIDLYGQIYNAPLVQEFARENNVQILEDACQAIGAEQNGKKAGNISDLSAFSFYATKNIMCGEGGMIVGNNEALEDICRQFRHHGQSKKTYEYLHLGYNYRMTDLCAAIALVQLEKLNSFTEKRINNAKRLSEGLKDISGLIIPKINKGNRHVFHQYTIRVTEDFKHSRDSLKEHLKSKGIVSAVYYPKPLHLHPHFMKLGYQQGDFPVAEMLSKEALSVPVHPGLSEIDLDAIIDAIKEYAR